MNPKALPWIIGVILFIIAGFVFYQHQNADVSTEYKKIDDTVFNNPKKNGEVWQVTEGIKTKLLKDPDSYDPIQWFQVVKDKEGNFTVRHRFRMKRPEGGYEDPVTLKFTVNPDGEVIDVK